jgi:hypothetical protein
MIVESIWRRTQSASTKGAEVTEIRFPRCFQISQSRIANLSGWGSPPGVIAKAMWKDIRHSSLEARGLKMADRARRRSGRRLRRKFPGPNRWNRIENKRAAFSFSKQVITGKLIGGG